MNNISLVTIRSKIKEKNNEDEYYFQNQLLSENKNRPFHIKYYEDFDIKDEFNEFSNKLDIPQTDIATFPLYLISKFAKSKNIRVGLSGDGSDELFGGYKKFNYLKLVNYLPLKKLIKKFSNKKYISILDKNILLQSLLLGTGSIDINKIKKLSNNLDLTNLFSKNIEKINSLIEENQIHNLEDQLLLIEQKILLPNIIL